MEKSISKDDLVPQDIWVPNLDEDSNQEEFFKKDALPIIDNEKIERKQVSENQSSQQIISKPGQDMNTDFGEKNKVIELSEEVDKSNQFDTKDLDEIEVNVSGMDNSFPNDFDKEMLKIDSFNVQSKQEKIKEYIPRKISQTEVYLQILGFILLFELLRLFFIVF